MRRRLIQLGLFLLAGAIVNVAVAWGCAYYVLTPETVVDSALSIEGPTSDQWRVAVLRKHGQVRILSSRRSRHFRRPGEPTPIGPAELVPRWAGFLYPESLEGANMRLIAADARGWPLVAMFSAFEVEVGSPGDAGMRSSSGPIALGDHKRMIAGCAISPADPNVTWISPYHIRAIPTKPIWSGFAINTVFYAAALWLLFATPLTLRRRRRIRRGLCPSCEYDLRGRLPTDSQANGGLCPECGASA
jgi:hypothetical protein